MGRVDAVRLKNTISAVEKTLIADVVITAFGFRASPADWLSTHGVALEETGRIAVTKAAPFQTSNPKIFAGGDNVRGADLVVTAVHDGREAELAIARWLKAPHKADSPQ